MQMNSKIYANCFEFMQIVELENKFMQNSRSSWPSEQNCLF